LADSTAITDLFSQFGAVAKAKLLIHGSFGASYESLMGRLRSLNIEHVSPAELIKQEISRCTPVGQRAERAARSGQTVPDETITALMRRWFWARKPDAGFVLTDFPATLLQAKVFDEWLDARNETLDGAVVFGSSLQESVLEHYRMHGLLIQTVPVAA
jgi:adenylate kinase